MNEIHEDNDLPRFDRVELTYIPTQGDEAGDDVELPLRIMVIGDFAAEATHEQGPIGTRKLFSVDKNNFHQVLKDISPRVKGEYTYYDQEAKEEIRVPYDFRIESMQDFTPDNLVKKVPSLNKLVLFREWLVRLKEQPEKTAEIIPILHEIHPQYCAKLLWRDLQYKQLMKEKNQ